MKNNKGFSLVELIVVIAIMAILAAVAIPTFAHFITKAEQASDDDLLHNINYIFEAACMENGVDVRDVTSATWDMEDMLVTAVTVNGASRTDIVDSFATHFDLTDAEFINVENLIFDGETLHAFVAWDGEVFTFNGATITISPEYLEILRGDNAFSDRGAAALLDDVGTLENLLDTGIGQDVLTSVKQSDDFLWALGSYAGIVQGVDESDDDYLDRVAAYATDPENEDAVYSAQIMFAASQAADATDEQLNRLFAGDVTSNIEVKNNGVTDYNATMANAALTYGMYTAFIERYPDAENADNFTLTVNSEAFQTYYNSPEGQTDLEAYRAAMNVIGDNTNNPEVTGSILENGIEGNEELETLMTQIMGK